MGRISAILPIGNGVPVQPESSPESVLREALGQLDVFAELRRTGTSQIDEETGGVAESD